MNRKEVVEYYGWDNVPPGVIVKRRADQMLGKEWYIKFRVGGYAVRIASKGSPWNLVDDTTLMDPDEISRGTYKVVSA